MTQHAGSHGKSGEDRILPSDIGAASSAFAVPSGIIAMWSGAVADVPLGWYLCDGTNGTPNLTDKFIVGAGATYAVAASGGAATHTLTTGEIPAHSHEIMAGTALGGANYGTFAVGTTSSTGPQTSSISAGGTGGAHNNLPPYYALAYIMKS